MDSGKLLVGKTVMFGAVRGYPDMAGLGAWAPRPRGSHTGLWCPWGFFLPGHPARRQGGNGSLSGVQFGDLEPSTMKILESLAISRKLMKLKQSFISCASREERGKAASDVRDARRLSEQNSRACRFLSRSASPEGWSDPARPHPRPVGFPRRKGEGSGRSAGV